MSTKIFNGYKIEKEMSAFELSEYMNDMRVGFNDICKDLYHKEVAKLASKYLDFKIAFGEDKANNIIKDTYHYEPKTDNDCLYLCVARLVNRDNESKEIMHSNFDFNCELKLLPIKNKTLFLLYSSKKEYKKLLDNYNEDGVEVPSSKYPLISSYIYYNNSDKPPHLSNDEWNNRMNDWNEALKNDENGFIYSLTKAPYTFNTNLLTDKISEMYAKRINTLVTYKIETDFFKENQDLVSKDDISSYFEAYNKYRKTNEYKLKLDKLTEEFKLIVPLTYCREDFNDIKLKNS